MTNKEKRMKARIENRRTITRAGQGCRIHSHERDDRAGNNYSPDGGDTYDLG